METVKRIHPDQHEHFTNERVEEYKGFRLVSSDPYGYWHVENIGGGPVGGALTGEWTGKYELKKKIDWYVNHKDEIANAPPQDKNTKKVKEIMKQRGASTLGEALAAGTGGGAG